MSDSFRSSIILSPLESKSVFDALVSSGRGDLADFIRNRSKCTDEAALYPMIARCFGDDDLVFDEDPAVSVSEGGAFVSAWVWVSALCEDEDAA